MFVAEYLGYEIAENYECIHFSNGLIVDVYKGDYIIKLGEVITKQNIKQKTEQNSSKI